MNDQAGAWEQRIPREQLWPIMIGIMLVLLLASLDQTIVSTALPRIIADLKGFDRYSWVATVYLLTSTVTVPIYGKLSDLYGRKRLLLFGVAVFLLGSALSGLAETMNQLIAARGLQGLGAGALMPIVIATMGDLFSPRERGKWQGLTGGVFGLAAIVGPSTGGFITDHFSWRWVFYVNLPLGIAAFVVLLILMPPLRFHREDVRIDYAGAIVLVLALFPLLLALAWAGSSYDWISPQVDGLLIWSLLALIVFVRIELRTPQPIVAPHLFQNRIVAVSVLVTFLVGATMFGGIFYIPLFIQGVIGSSATASGTVLTPLMVTAIVGSILAGQAVSRTGRYRYIALAGTIIMCAGTALLLRLDLHSQYHDVAIPMIIIGAGMGAGMSLYTVIVQNAVPQSVIGQATGAVTFMRQLGGTVGLALMGSFVTSRFSANIHADLPATVRRALGPATGGLDNPQVLISSNAQASLQHALRPFGSQGVVLYEQLRQAIRLALSASLHDVFVLEVLVAFLPIAVVLFLPEIALRGATPKQQVEEDEGVAAGRAAAGS